MTIPEPYFQDEWSTLYHGDCLTIAPLLTGIDAVISDPPYGMNWHADTTRFGGGHNPKHRGKGRNDRLLVIGDDKPFDPSPWLNYPAVVLWGMHHYAQRLPAGTVLVWIKRLDASFGEFLSDAELAWMKGGCGVYCKRDLSMNAETLTRQHPTQKPVSLMLWCLEQAKVQPGQTILDPYMGSGTTLVAAKLRGIKAVGIELSEEYCQIAVKRLRQEVLPLYALPTVQSNETNHDLF